MKTLLIFLGMLVCKTGFSQNVIDVDKSPVDRLSPQLFYVASGFPVSNAKYVRLTSGSPYFSENWMKGTIFVTDSSGARNLMIRLDLLDGSLLYLDNKQQEMIYGLPAIQVTMTDTITGAKYIFINTAAIAGSKDKASWYQVLAGERLTLFKEYHKQMLESKAYGSSITEQMIQTTEKYYIGLNGEMTRVKQPADIAELAGKKSKQMMEYIRQNKLTKKEADLVALVAYYHTL